ELDDEDLAAVAPTLTRGVFTGSPVFDGSKETEIKALLRSSGLPESGKTNLYDGMTGEKFEQPVTVGYIYMQKLSHLDDDKIRSELDDEDLAAVAPTLTRGVFTGSPVFDGSKETEIKALLRSSGLPESGKTNLYDGMTGEKFEQPVTVGYIYMLKLSHLVDDKI